MTKSEANKQWAELEGYEYMEAEPNEYEAHWIIPRKHRENDPFQDITKELPDFTEPNRFFAEVVPRMNMLNFHPQLHRGSKDGLWQFEWWNFEVVLNVISSHKEIGEAGLIAAIKARKELKELNV